MKLKYVGTVTTDYFDAQTGVTFHVVPGDDVEVSDGFGSLLLKESAEQFESKKKKQDG